MKLKETHPDLYDKAKEYEVPFEKTGNFFTWSQGESLAELEQPERMAQIKHDHALRVERMAQRKDNSTLIAVFSELDSTETPEDDDDMGCAICSI
ncbi:hypothetical protein [Pseudomonas syringae group genomosp. 3]|uniref:hypothetical protein n=1 Tax=Pseudomonas syringae group genomosp. 3 TaxID=251701 RepID=UPI001C81E692|nr:hypothetical protein [Pseudomonas syringae group genomosp. 3]